MAWHPIARLHSWFSEVYLLYFFIVRLTLIIAYNIFLYSNPGDFS